MNRILVATGCAMLAAGTAFAQAATPDGTPSWTGPYVGIFGGYDVDDGGKISDTGSTANNIFALQNGIRPFELNQNRAGGLGGGRIGYDLQAGHVVVGALGDFAYDFSHGTTTYASPQAFPGFPAGRLTTVDSRLRWMGTARARLGYQLGQGMVYATGGYAFGKVKGSAEFDGDPASTVNYFGRHSYTAQGWTAGGGLEFRPFAQGMLSHISVNAEALYYDLGRSHIFADQTGTPPGFYELGVTTRGISARGGISYHF